MNLPDKAKFEEELRKNPKATKADIAEILDVYDFSVIHHMPAPRRATGEHYFWHIFRGAMNLLFVFQMLIIWDVKTIKIFLLHDVIEDARKAGFDPELVLQKVIIRFGNEIAFGAMAMTKQGNDHARDVLARLTMFFYWRSLLAKIFDRDDNLSTLYGMEIKSQRKKLAETKKYFPAIFNRLEAELKIAVEYRNFDNNWLRLVPILRERQAKLISENYARLAREGTK